MLAYAPVARFVVRDVGRIGDDQIRAAGWELRHLRDAIMVLRETSVFMVFSFRGLSVRERKGQGG